MGGRKNIDEGMGDLRCAGTLRFTHAPILCRSSSSKYTACCEIQMITIGRGQKATDPRDKRMEGRTSGTLAGTDERCSFFGVEKPTCCPLAVLWRY